MTEWNNDIGKEYRDERNRLIEKENNLIIGLVFTCMVSYIILICFWVYY